MKAYIVNLSTGSLQIDEDELPDVIAGINAGGIVAVRKGIFNPSYFVCLEEDTQRLLTYSFKVKAVEEKNLENKIMKRGKPEELPEFEKLSSIFENDKFLKKLNIPKI